MQLSASSIALDLAPLSQTHWNTFMQWGLHNSIGKSSEWPQFSGPPHAPDITVTSQRLHQHHNVTNPPHHLGVLSPIYEPKYKLPISTVSASATPSIVQHHTPNDSRHSSPPGFSDTLSTLSSIAMAWHGWDSRETSQSQGTPCSMGDWPWKSREGTEENSQSNIQQIVGSC